MHLQPGELPLPSTSRPWAGEDAPAAPSRNLQARWKARYCHEMRPWDRPGALSRTSIPRTRFVGQRPEIQVDTRGRLRLERLSLLPQGSSRHAEIEVFATFSQGQYVYRTSLSAVVALQ